MVASGGDCDDGDSDIHPGATETCDDVDEDCDGILDDGLEFNNWYTDADGDGHGADHGIAISACSQPEGRVSSNDDCDDHDAGIYPGATETFCDNIDSDCDGFGRYEVATADGVAYATIQEAVDNTPQGGSVGVCPGVWAGPVEVREGAVLSIEGLGGAESVVLDGEGSGPLLNIGEGASVETRDLTFTNCDMSTGDGGAIASSASELHLLRCVFAGNTARRGGAIAANVPLDGGEGSIIAEASAFTDNYGIHEGGAIAILARDGDVGFSAAFDECEFSGNRSGAGGGALAYLASKGVGSNGGLTLRATRTAFNSNEAVGNGGALYLLHGHWTGLQVLDLDGCEFNGNFSFGQGGAVFRVVETVYPSIAISGTTFDANFSDLGGGALMTYGTDYATVEIADSAFTGNETRGWGGAILLGSPTTSLDILDTAFVDNLALEAGGALTVFGDTPGANIWDCLFEENVAMESGAISIDRDVTAEIFRTSFSGNTASGGGAGAIGVSKEGDTSQVVLRESSVVTNTAHVLAGGVCIQDQTDLTVEQVDWGSDVSENVPADLCVGDTCWTDLVAGESFTCPGDGTCSR